MSRILSKVEGQKGNALLVVLLLVLVVGVGGYYLYSKGMLNLPTPQNAQTSSVFNYGSTSLTTNSQLSQEAGSVASNNLKLTITSPVNGAILNSTSLTLTGKTSPGAEVFVNDQSTKADATGNFSVKLTLDEGQNGIVVTANDDNGNVTEEDLSVNVQTF